MKNPDYKGNRVAKNDGVTFKVYTKDEPPTPTSSPVPST